MRISPSSVRFPLQPATTPYIRPIDTAAPDTVRPIKSATGAPHRRPTAKSRRKSSVPMIPQTFPPNMIPESTTLSLGSNIQKVFLMTYVPLSTLFSSVCEKIIACGLVGSTLYVKRLLYPARLSAISLSVEKILAENSLLSF